MNEPTFKADLDNIDGWAQEIKSRDPNQPPCDGVIKPNTAEPAKFKFVSVSDLEYRDPEYLVADLFEAETLGLIFGDPGCGKSFLAVDIALSVATGAAFHGKDVKKGAVFFIAGEGHNGLARRFAAWSEVRGVPLSNVPLFKSERAAQFLDAASAEAVVASVTDMASNYGPPALIIIDTLARNFGAGDENSTKDMNEFITAVDGLKAPFPKCTVLIVHHSGHGDKLRARGAMSLKGAMDAEYRVEKDNMSVTLTCTKMKDAPEPLPLFFKLEGVALDRDATSAVLMVADAPKTKRKALKGKNEIAMQALRDALRDHGIKKAGDHYPDSRNVVEVNNWRNACNAHGLTTGVSDSAARTAFKRAKDKLMELDEVREWGGYVWVVQDE